MATLTTVYQTELIKSKNTFALWLVVLGAAFVPFLMFLIYMNKWENFLPKPGENPWNQFFIANWQVVSFIFIPFFIVLLCALVIGIEHKSNSWKHLFTLPVSKFSVYTSKLSVVLSLVLFCYLLFVLFLFMSGTLLGILRPKLAFLSHTPNVAGLLQFAGKSLVATLGMVAVHFWLSIRLRNLIQSVGIGLVCIVTATILFQRWENAVYFPYTYTMYTLTGDKESLHSLSKHEMYSLAYFVVVIGLGYVDFSRFYRG
ncbi:MAG: ABC transporter permease [Cytophagales bacterium]|jgi:hypothetical protein|nr:ABC transporter permease [Cytophagales bacterium]